MHQGAALRCVSAAARGGARRGQTTFCRELATFFSEWNSLLSFRKRKKIRKCGETDILGSSLVLREL